MGTLVPSPPLIPDNIVSTESLLPRESPLAMAAGELDKTPAARAPPLVTSTMRWRRAVILLSTAALTGAGGYEMYRVLQVGGVTVLEAMVLSLFLLLLAGSYEEVPPSLLDFAARDRRWCQGNLQHLAVVLARGLHWVSRLHFMVGIGAYLTAPLWLLFLLLGMLISLQARYVRPEYFPKGFSLFPTWPAQDPVLATWVFVATMGLLVLPKILSVVLLWTQRPVRRQFGGGIRASASVFVEVVVSALMAPVMMIFQSIAVIEILIGRDAGWQTQRRDDGSVERRELYRKYGIPTLCGIVMAAGAYAVSR